MSDVEIYQVDLRQISFRNAISKLSQRDLSHAANIMDHETQQCFIKSRAVLLAILSRRLGADSRSIDFSYMPQGKPFLEGQNDLHFNLSHSGHYMMLAIACFPVGIDIEKISTTFSYQDVAKQVFSDEENELLSNAPLKSQNRKFYSLWTRKEAYLKAIGCGFSEDPTLISTHDYSGEVVDQRSDISDKDQDLPSPWYVKTIDLKNDLAFALAVPRRDANIELKEFEASAL